MMMATGGGRRGRSVGARVRVGGPPRFEALEGRALLNARLDPAFADAGRALIPVAFGEFDQGTVTDAAVQPDGKVVLSLSVFVGGDFERSAIGVMRLTADGRLDPTFGEGGRALVPFTLPGYGGVHNFGGVALQSDGKIVVATSARKLGPIANDFDFAAVRLNPDGSPDAGFGQLGRVAVPFDINELADWRGDYAADVAVQPDGRIVLAGSATADTYFTRAAAARLNPDGSLDTGFGDGGRVLVQRVSSIEAFTAVAVQPDGRPLFAGGASTPIPLFPDGRTEFFVARRTADGAPDQSFGAGGRTAVSFESFGDRAYARALAVQDDGRIVVAGEVAVPEADGDSAIAVARLGPDGELDPSFGDGGRVVVADDRGPTDRLAAEAVAIRPDGRIVVAGTERHGVDFAAALSSGDFVVALLGPDGTPDRGLGPGGRTSIGFALDVPGAPSLQTVDGLGGLALQDDGGIVVAGFAGTGASALGRNVAVARLLPGPPALDVEVASTIETPRRDSLPSIVVRFSAPIDPATFSPWAISLTRDLRPVPLDGGLTITPVAGDPRSYTVSGLERFTVEEGRYRLTVDASGVVGLGGEPGVDATTAPFRVGIPRPVSVDFDGDGRDDQAIYTRAEGDRPGRLDAVLSSGGTRSQAIGGPDDVPIVGDFDGDGRTEVAVYGFSAADSYSVFSYVRSSDGQAVRVAFGGRDDRPVAGDYDGDGITDLAVFGFSPQDGAHRFAIRPSSDPDHAYPVRFGGLGDGPVAGDFDGDGVTDLAVYGALSGSYSGFTLRRSSQPTRTEVIPFGGIVDLPTVGDYDGDGRSDLAVYGFSTLDGLDRFAIRPSSDPGRAFPVPFGALGDEPVSVDYDGDGTTDRVVYGDGPGDEPPRLTIATSGDGRTRTVPVGTLSSVALPRPLRFSALLPKTIDG